MNLQIFFASHSHCHGDEILKVALKKLCLHLCLCFLNVTSEWCLPKELVKLMLCVTLQIIVIILIKEQKGNTTSQS